MLEELFVEACFFQCSLTCFDVEIEGASLAAVVDAFLALEDRDVYVVVGSMFEKTRKHTTGRTGADDGNLQAHSWFDGSRRVNMVCC